MEQAITSKRLKKYLTVMFIDIAGSTDLFLDHDEEDVGDLLISFIKRARHIIEGCHGQINQTLGDGLYAVFGLNGVISEHQSAWACWAAMRVQQEFKDLKIKVGIDAGYLVWDPEEYCSDLHLRFVGEPVNLAAHICDSADPGVTLVSENCHQQLKKFFRLTQKEAVKSKGGVKNTTYSVEGFSSQDSESISTTSFMHEDTLFVGRSLEVDTIVQSSKQSLTGKSKHIYIHGEAGIGKTSLISKSLERIRSELPWVKVFSYSQLPYLYGSSDIIDNFIRDALQTLNFVSSNPELIKQFIDKHRLNNATALWILLEFLVLPVEDPDWAALDQNQKNFVKADFLASLIASISIHQPLVVVFEDIHWSDDTGDILLKALDSKMQDGSFIMLTSSRSTAGAEKLKHPHIIELRGLHDTQAYKLIDHCVEDKRIPRHIKNSIIRKSNRNPYYTIQIAQYLKKKLATGIGFYIHQKDLIPETLDVTVSSCIEMLSKEDQEVLYAASIIGQKFNSSYIENMVSYSNNDVFASLKNIEEINIIRRINPLDRGYEFTHALAQDSVYRSLTKSLRKKLHGKLLDTIKNTPRSELNNRPALLATHAYKAGMHQLAYAYCSHVANKSLNNSMPLKAQEYYEMCIKSINASKTFKKRDYRLIRSLIGLSKAYTLSGNPNLAKPILKDASEKLKSFSGKNKFNLKQSILEVGAATRWVTFDYNRELIYDLESQLNLSTQAGISTAIRYAGMLADHGYFCEANDRFLSFLGKFKRTELDHNIGHLFPIYSVCLSQISRNYGEMGKESLAREYAIEALSCVEHHGYSPRKVHALTFSASHLIREGRYQEACVLMEEAYILTQEFNIGMIYPFAASQYGLCKYFLSRNINHAEPIFNALEFIKKTGCTFRSGLFHLYLTEIYFDCGDIEKAENMALQAKELSLKNQERWVYAHVGMLLTKQSLLGTIRNPEILSQQGTYTQESLEIAKRLNLKPILDDYLKICSSVETVH